MSDISQLIKNLEKEPKTKKEEFHKNLHIAFVSLGIVVFLMSGLIKFYTLKHMKK